MNKQVRNHKQLEAEAFALYKTICAAENWEAGYEQQAEAFEQLIDAEAKMERAMRRYLREFANERAEKFIDRMAYNRRVQANNLTVNYDNNLYDEEIRIIVNFMLEPTAQAVGAGVAAQEAATNISLGENANVLIRRAAKSRTLELASKSTKTHRSVIQEVLEEGVAQRKTLPDVTSDIKQIVNNRKRAEMVARTESVNAYSMGTEEFGKQTGAKGKEWRTAQAGACEICQEMGEKYGRGSGGVAVDGSFDSEFIEPPEHPPAHPNCRCRLVLSYD